MAVAVSKALEDGRRGDRVRVDREHRRLGRRVRRARRADGGRPRARRARSRAAKLAQSRAVGARVLEVRGSFDEALASCLRARRARRRTRSSTRSTRTGSRARRRPRSRSTRSSAARPTCSRCPYGGGGNTVAYAKGFAEDGAQPRMISAHAAERATTLASAIRIAEPAHLAEVEALVADGTRRAGRGHRRGHHANVARARQPGGHLLRAVVGGRARRARAASTLEPGSTVVCVLTGHGLKDTAAVDDSRPEPALVEPTVESILEALERSAAERRDFVVRAPATTANLGPGLRLRRRGARPLERAARLTGRRRRAARRRRGRGRRRDAARRDAPRAARVRARRAARGHRFRFVNRIPLERGLGSSAATVAAGLVAGRGRRGPRREPDELLELGLPLEGHADNLAPRCAAASA